MDNKVVREKETIERMIHIFCKKHHQTTVGICDDCRNLSVYAAKCVSLCPFGTSKPVCGRCPANCFHSEMHGKMKQVMRYAGPQMLYKHPILAVRHLIDAFKKIPSTCDKN